MFELGVRKNIGLDEGVPLVVGNDAVASEAGPEDRTRHVFYLGAATCTAVGRTSVESNSELDVSYHQLGHLDGPVFRTDVHEFFLNCNERSQQMLK